MLSRLERQLDYVKQQDVCVLPITKGMKTPADIGQKIDVLLNSDNQFALDSSELNPKYIGRLAEAAQLLINNPEYKIRITGHADALGERSHNLALSLERAHQVGRYLQILGLPIARIQFDGVSSDRPLFHDDTNQPHVRLVNRRVNIELIEMQIPKQKVREQ
jgi:outer membrane protein OmpA-like peptidoglycan-associated protein